MKEIKDGGPAFPRSSQGPSDSLDCKPGMTLRQYFAGKALQGELACQVPVSSGFGGTAEWRNPGELAKRCFDISDAMIAFEENENKEA